MNERETTRSSSPRDEIDVERLMDEVRESVRRRAEGDGLLPPAAGDRTRRDPAVEADLAAISASANVYDVRFRSHRRWLGPLVVRMFGFVRLLLTPVLTRQTAHNTATARALASLRADFERFERERVERENVEWRRREEEGRRREAERQRRESARFDSLAFHNRFRGSEGDVRERQRVWVDLFRGGGDVLDVGCGRGELLELLREAGVPARGVDSDPAVVWLCERKGLPVECADAMDVLRGLDDGSLGGIFAGQVIEHLAFEDLMSLLRLCHRKLRPGGVLVAETPNPKCLSVFARSFYADPGHIRPVHPDTLRFLFEDVGFSSVELRFGAPVETELRLAPAARGEAIPEELVRRLEGLDDLLFGDQDYAAIGRKD